MVPWSTSPQGEGRVDGVTAACQCHWICSPLSGASSSAASDIADDFRGINSE